MPSWPLRWDRALATDDPERFNEDKLIPRMRALMKIPDLQPQVLGVGHWIVQGVLAVLFLGAGLAKLTQARERLQAMPQMAPVVPQPDPHVPPTPVVSGRRVIFLVREAKEVTPQFNRTELDLTSGESWKVLTQKKHDLLILSDDRGIPSNYPAIAQAAFQKAKGLSLPSIAILDPASWAELYVGPVDKNAKPEDIMSLIQKYGG